MRTSKTNPIGPVLYLGQVGDIEYYQSQQGYVTHFLLKDQAVVRPFYGLITTSAVSMYDNTQKAVSVQWEAQSDKSFALRIKALLGAGTPLFAFVQWPGENWLQAIGLQGGVTVRLESLERGRQILTISSTAESLSVPQSVLPQVLGEKPRFRLSETIQTGAFDQLVALIPEPDSPASVWVLDELWFGDEWVPLLGPVPQHPEQRYTLIAGGPSRPAQKLQYVCPAGGGYSLTSYERG